MDRDRYTLQQYIRHAQLYGVECVYETAEQQEMPAKELFELATALRRRDARFRLTDQQVKRLIERGVSASRLRRALGLSDTATRRSLTTAAAA